MQKSKVLKKLRNGKPVFFPSTAFSDPNIVELIGSLGFECIWICQEHLWSSNETIEEMIRASRCTNMDAMIRIDKNNYTSAIKPLEMGAKGLMIPHITNADEAEYWVKNTKFYPFGKRAISGGFIDSDFVSIDLKEYMEFSNKETFIAVQIEDVEAIPNIDEIASIEGIDILFIGLLDLSVSMGFGGEIDRKEIWEVIKKIGQAAKKNNKFAGAPTFSFDWTKKLLEEGYLFISHGSDFEFIKNSLLILRKDYKENGFEF